MKRRDFCTRSGLGLLAFTLLPRGLPGWAELNAPENGVWIHGSPYLGHSDYRPHFRWLSPGQIREQIVHFRTAEPWRRRILFNAREDS